MKRIAVLAFWAGQLCAQRAEYEYLHAHPELGKQEVETARYIRERLSAYGYRDLQSLPALPTMVLTVLDTGRPGKTIAFRSELDARPTTERTGLPYASVKPGVMHSCGHDAHAAILLGLAKLLQERRAALTGRVVLLFQPAEEIAGGADEIVADGILQRLGVQAIFALHSASSVPVGTAQIAPGPVLAGSSYFSVKVNGRSSHAAAPQEGNDVLLATMQMAAALEHLPARRLDILQQPAVVSVAYFRSGDEKAANVLSSEAVFGGTVRSFTDIEEGTPSLRSMITDFLQRSAAVHGVQVDVQIRRGSPVLKNNAALYQELLPRIAKEWTGKLEAGTRGMFSEDFAYYTSALPSLYFSLGVMKGELGREPVHSDRFTVHPDALAEGVNLLFAVVQASLVP